MTRNCYLQPLLVICIFLCGSVISHPQCLDYRAPFEPVSNLTFCSMYSDLGCCGQSGDDRLKVEYEYIRSNVTQRDWQLCQDFVKDILCQKCSPYAAHIYDAELSTPRQFPGLCEPYCEQFFDECRQLVWFFDTQLAFSTVIGSRRRFCKRVGLEDKDYCYPDLLDGVRSQTATQDSSPGCLCVREVGTDLANPLFARPARDGTGRVFVAEQAGRVRIYNARQNKWQKDLFLDFTDRAVVSSFPGDERGFLGMAFHPNFSTNQRFFVFYSTKRRLDDVIPEELDSLPFTYRSKTVISELTTMADNPNRADPASAKVLLELFQPYPNHNGGEMFFGTDGYLYTFHGDGGGGGDPLKAGQNKSLLLGKVLRLDVDSEPSPPLAYAIPQDNPFVNESRARPEIYAYGIRNIWRCGMDQGDRKTGEGRGRVLCGDVGQSRWEEVDLLKKGANYGWNSREGFECFDNDLCGNIGEEELPLTAYDHSVGKSVTGGVFYRGCDNPTLSGQYIYGDYDSRQLFSLTFNPNNDTWTNKYVSLCDKDKCQGDLKGDVGGKILSFGEDEDGEIYVLTSPTVSSKSAQGKMMKIVDPSTRPDPALCAKDATETSRVPLPKKKRLTQAEYLDRLRRRSMKRRRRKPKIRMTIRIRGKKANRKHQTASRKSSTPGRRKQRQMRSRRQKYCRKLQNKRKKICRKRKRRRTKPMQATRRRHRSGR